MDSYFYPGAPLLGLATFIYRRKFWYIYIPEFAPVKWLVESPSTLIQALFLINQWIQVALVSEDKNVSIMLSRGRPICAMRWWNKSQVLCRSCGSLDVQLYCPLYRASVYRVFWERINGLWFSHSASHRCHNGGFQEASAEKTRTLQIVIINDKC